MSIAVIAQPGAAHRPQAARRPTRKRNAAVLERMGKAHCLEPLRALVEARMLKAQIEIECWRRSCGALPRDADKLR